MKEKRALSSSIVHQEKDERAFKVAKNEKKGHAKNKKKSTRCEKK